MYFPELVFRFQQLFGGHRKFSFQANGGRQERALAGQQSITESLGNNQYPGRTVKPSRISTAMHKKTPLYHTPGPVEEMREKYTNAARIAFYRYGSNLAIF